MTGCTLSQAAVEDTTEPEVETTTEATEPAETEAPAVPSTGDTPEWADGPLDVGELIGSGSGDSWSIEVYQVGTGVTDRDSMFVNPDTNENVLPAGSEIVFVNIVVTNTTGEAIPLGYSLASPDLRHENWPYIQGQPGASTSGPYDELGLSDTGYIVGSDVPFIVGPGQSFAQATSIGYEPGNANLRISLTPVDEEGDLNHDLNERIEITVTIK